MSQQALTPIVKWAGGKRRLLPEITARFPRTFARYYEPFAGGAAVFFHLRPEQAVITDRNIDLIATYRAVADDPMGVIRALATHSKAHCTEHYYATRTKWNAISLASPAARQRDTWPPAELAATLIYLNRTCYNGLWRVNRSGGFNVPMGRYKKPLICDAVGVQRASQALRQVQLRCCDYSVAIEDAQRGDLVYFDPPYDPTTPTANFVSYTAGAFGQADQRALAALVHTLAERGVSVVLSNSDTPLVRSLYRGMRIDRVRCGRAINCNSGRRGEADEVLVSIQ